MQQFVKGMGVVLVAAIVLAVPAIALTRVVSFSGTPVTGVSIESQDDPMANGLKVYTKSVAAAPAPSAAAVGEGSAEVSLQGWTFTRTKPSAGH